ncbi:unnamed protein product [Nezara viridula]|uniref:Uncharacterized protein n=1 Tax=Nezara viridula TaxID=85310 RepID=A0A9P0MW25_NEZVI|nr:unnamed protein product [Nezara viridula]
MPFPVLPWIFLTILLKETACHSGRSRNGKNAMPGKITVSVETKQKICTTVHANLGRAAAVKYRGHQSTFCTAPNCKTPHESSVGPVILHVCQDSVTDQLLEMGPEDSITNLDYSNISVAGNLRPLLSDLQTIINYIDASLSHINRPDLNKAKIERGFNKLVMNLANTLKGLKIIDPIQFQKSVLQIVHGMKQKSPSKDRKGKDVKGLTNNILSSLQRLNQVILGITSKKNFKQTGVYRQPGVSTKSVKIDTRKNRIPTPVTKPTLTDEVFPDTEKQHITIPIANRNLIDEVFPDTEKQHIAIISGLGSPENLEEKLGQLTQKIPSTPTGSDLSQLDNELNLLIKKIAALNGPGTLFHPINLRSDIKKLKTVSGDAGSRPNKGTLDHDSITDRLLSLVKKLNFITNELGKLLAMKKTGQPGYQQEPNMPMGGNHIPSSGGRPGYQPEPNMPMGGSSTPSSGGRPGYQPEPNMPMGGNHIPSSGGRPGYKQEPNKPVGGSSTPSSGGRPGYQPGPNMPMGGKHSPSIGGRPGYQQEPNMPMGGNHIPSSGGRPGYKQEPTKPVGGISTKSSGGRPGYKQEPNKPVGGSSTPSSGGRPGYKQEPNKPVGGISTKSSGGRPGYKQEPNKPVGGISTPSSGGRPGYQQEPNIPMGGSSTPSSGGRPGYQQEPNMHMGGDNIPSNRSRPGYQQEPNMHMGGDYIPSNRSRPGYQQEPNMTMEGSYTPSSGGQPGYQQEPNMPMGGSYTPSSGGRPGYQQEPNMPMGGSYTQSSGGRPGYLQEPNMPIGGSYTPSSGGRPGYQQEPNMPMGGIYTPSSGGRPGYQQEPNMLMGGSYTPSSGGRPGYQQEPNMPMGEDYIPSNGSRPEYQQEPNMPMGGDYIPSNGSSPGYQQEPNMPMGPRYTSSSGGRPGYQQEPYMPRGENYTPSGLGYSRREHEPNMPTRANHIRPSGDSVEPGYQNDDKIIMEDSSPDISMDENSFLPSKRGYCTYHELPIQPSKKKHFLRRGGGMKVRQHTLDPVTKNMISTLHQMETIVQGLIDLQRMFASSRPGYQPEPNMPTGGNHSPSSGDRPGYQQEPNMPTGGNHIPSSGDRPGYQQEPNMPTGGNHIPSSGETSEATKNPSRNHQADIAAIMHRIQTSFRHFNETYHDLAKHQKPNQDGSHPPEIHHENTDENKPHEAEAEIKEVPEVHFDNINETIPDDNENVEILINQLLETDSDNPAINEEHGSDVHINETVTDQPVPQSFDRETVGRRINNTMESLNQMIVDLSALQVLNKGDSVRPEHSSVNEKGPNKQQIVELTKNIHSTLKYLSKILDDLQILQTTETQGVPGERYHNLEGEVEELSKHLVTGPDAGQHSVGSDTSKILSTLQESVTDTELREIIREYTIVVERFKIYGYEYLHHTEENKEHPEDEPPVADDFYKMKYPVVEQEHRIESLIKILESDEIIESFWKPEYGNTTGIKEAQTTLEQILSQSVKAAENQMGYHKIAKLICVILRLQEKELLAFDLMPYILYFYWILDMNNNESMKFGSSYLQRPDLVLPKGEKPIDTLIMTIKSPLFKEVFWDPEYGGTEKMESIIATFTETFLNGKQGVQSTNDLIKTMCILITLLDTGLVNLTQVEIDSLFKYLFPILDSLILKGHHYVPDSYLKKVDEEHKGYYSDYFVDKLKAAHHTEQQ